VTHAQHELDRKRLEILKEAVPSVSRVVYLFDSRAIPETALRALDESAGPLKVRLQRVGVTRPEEIEPVSPPSSRSGRKLSSCKMPRCSRDSHNE
jgi:hypothetical protein